MEPQTGLEVGGRGRSSIEAVDDGGPLGSAQLGRGVTEHDEAVSRGGERVVVRSSTSPNTHGSGIDVAAE